MENRNNPESNRSSSGKTGIGNKQSGFKDSPKTGSRMEEDNSSSSSGSRPGSFSSGDKR